MPPVGTEEISKTLGKNNLSPKLLKTELESWSQTFVQMRKSFHSAYYSSFFWMNVHILFSSVITVCFSSSPFTSDAAKPWRSVKVNVLSLHKSCFLRHVGDAAVWTRMRGDFSLLTALKNKHGGELCAALIHRHRRFPVGRRAVCFGRVEGAGGAWAEIQNAKVWPHRKQARTVMRNQTGGLVFFTAGFLQEGVRQGKAEHPFQNNRGLLSLLL